MATDSSDVVPDVDSSEAGTVAPETPNLTGGFSSILKDLPAAVKACTITRLLKGLHVALHTRRHILRSLRNDLDALLGQRMRREKLLDHVRPPRAQPNATLLVRVMFITLKFSKPLGCDTTRFISPLAVTPHW